MDDLTLKLPADLYHLARQGRCIAVIRREEQPPLLGGFELKNADNGALWLNGTITRVTVTTMQYLDNADAAACGFMHMAQLLDSLRLSYPGISVEEPITIYYWGETP